MNLEGWQPNWSCGGRRNHYSTHLPPWLGNQLQKNLRVAVAQTSPNTKETIVTITTRLTKRFGIRHPIVLAPMTPASGGALASAVARLEDSDYWVAVTSTAFGSKPNRQR